MIEDNGTYSQEEFSWVGNKFNASEIRFWIVVISPDGGMEIGFQSPVERAT